MQTELAPAETSRLAALYRYDVLDTPPEEAFDCLTRMAQMILQTPTVLVSLIDRDRQWFKSKQGMEASETSRELSFCAHAIRNNVPMIVCDAGEDPRFRDHPAVTGDTHVRFYMGVPLRTPDGYNIGTLCAVDQRPRQPSDDQVAVLQDLARLVVDALELRLIATTDSLTGALTRRAFMREAAQEQVRARRYDHPMSVLMLDADHFKRVNDTYGHATGDMVLRAIVANCRGIMRAADLLGRLGGEEFAILLPETDLAGAEAIAERLRQQIASTPIETSAGTVSITASLGVASLGPAMLDIESMLAAADAALYEAKAGGRNRMVLARR